LALSTFVSIMPNNSYLFLSKIKKSPHPLKGTRAKLIPKGEDLSDFDKFEELDEKRRELIGKVEELKGIIKLLNFFAHFAHLFNNMISVFFLPFQNGDLLRYTKVLRANFQEVKAKLIPKGEDLSDFDKFEELDEFQNGDLLRYFIAFSLQFFYFTDKLSSLFVQLFKLVKVR
jgi:hypothetical protein